MQACFAIDIPPCSTQMVVALNKAFETNAIPGFATFELSEITTGLQIEHLCCPVEPADPTTRIYIQIPDVQAALKNSLINDRFMVSAVTSFSGEVQNEDLFALECIVTSCLARDLTFTYLQQQHPKKLMSQANAVASQGKWVEDIFGTPDLLGMLHCFADTLLARGLQTR